jgi:predicted kinase
MGETTVTPKRDQPFVNRMGNSVMMYCRAAARRGNVRIMTQHQNFAGRLIIVCGLPGSGKTNHAMRVEEQSGAVRLCPDEWMEALEVDLHDGKARERIEALQWEFAKRLLTLGQTVIIEWGTWTRSERDALRRGARVLGASVELHFIDAPVNVLFERIGQRNRKSPPIQLADLLKWSGMFDRPSAEEAENFDKFTISETLPPDPAL